MKSEKEKNNDKEIAKMKGELRSLLHLYWNLEYFVDTLNMFHDIIYDRYYVEKKLNISLETRTEYETALNNLISLREYIKKQESVYQSQINILEIKLQKN